MNFQERIRKPVFNFGKNRKPISKTDSIAWTRVFSGFTNNPRPPNIWLFQNRTQPKERRLEFYPTCPNPISKKFQVSQTRSFIKISSNKKTLSKQISTWIL
ncbi:hypothetical protein LEP1GSC062_1079 [Leptospira alexanderi serovar Manhao 3 str. L 60]|uniref:Uncharacterized protein n=1 Tax=Leptospira alexanderi serovar Manhao 3 str. L 60 TaxID=1049759 RepID=V6I0W9_9LEPT|nr:hypothetical protein LEP1GSC062_1079 [Leptospira alexanderi serovar Manhao 3 str. L 60]